MKQENHPKEVRSNDRGANQDIDKEILGASSKSGEYLDGRNLRVSSIKSERAAAEKIKGEELVHANVNTGVFQCIASMSVNNKKFEVWVDKDGVEDPKIIIDGVIVAQSDKIPFLVEFPIQMDRNESCVGGEVFLTDFNTPPMIFNIEDMIDSLVSNPTKYFADFNPALYTVNLETPLNIPVFKELVNIGGINGLAPGSYIYSIRYATADGDRTDWSPPTPPIPVLDSLSSSGSYFPWLRTYGTASDLNNKTAYGIKLKFRVNNSANFDFLEIRRQDYNTGVGDTLTPNSLIVAKIDLEDGEISVKEFIDPKDSNVEDAISEEDEVNKLSVINKAKAIRYHDKRLTLMNVVLESKEVEGVVEEDINGVAAVPIVKKLGKAGFKDPVNHAYYKRHMSGESFGYGRAFFGSTGGASFVLPITGLENYQFPNRRDALGSDSKLYSEFGMPTTATNTGAVDNTFEPFDLEDAISKTDLCSFKNIIEGRDDILGVNLNPPGKSRSAVNALGCPDTGNGSFVSGEEVGYQPYRPVSKIDSADTYSYITNFKVDNGSSEVDYRPKGFAPNYYTNGLAVGGVKNLPNWVKGFSVVRTDPAERVLAQGVGFYKLIEGDFAAVGNSSLVSKEKKKFVFHSNDLEKFSSALISDISSNPGDYEVQFVSALGFFSEVYQYEQNTIQGDRDRIVDMISYARTLHDEGQINPTESGSMGIVSGGKNYVAHNRYRNSDPAMGDAFGGDGNTSFPISSLTTTTENGETYFELEVPSNIYRNQTIGGNSEKDFADTGLKNWTEPIYMINIINKGAEVRDSNINQYRNIGHFQKIESIIGAGDGLADQEFELVDERWEDCIPDINPSGNFTGLDSFVYVVDEFDIPRAWMNVTYKTALEITNITNDIIANGFYEPSPGVEVYGMYTHKSINPTNPDRDVFIVFNIPSFYPLENELIVVKYDDSRPSTVFGGDTVVSDNVFSPINKLNTKDTDADEMFVMNAGFPFRLFRINPRHYIVRDGSAAFNKVQDTSETSLGYIRQLMLLYTAETRGAVNYAQASFQDYANEYFPLVNYVMRPNKWDIDDWDDQELFEQYITDYPGEDGRWNIGGFRHNQSINLDYSVRGPLQYFSKPKFGFEEETDFCTAVMWSLPRAINVQDSPGLKTFTSLNRFDIADDQGEIKKAWDATTGGKGENLYAITKKGVCLLLTKKSILSNIDSDDLTTVASDQFISGEYWLSKSIGSPDEMWRGMGEGTVSIPTESGAVESEVLFFPSKQSVFSLINNQIKDIGRNKYLSRLKPFLTGLGPGYSGKLAGVINTNNNEYWLEIENSTTEQVELFAYGSENSLWEGSFDYRFDMYYMSDNKVYGVRDLQTFELEKGFIINNDNIVYELTTAFSPGNVSLEKEFIRIGVQSGVRGEMKPSSIEFYDQDMTLLCSVSQFNQGVLFLKQYDGWEQFIGRKNAAVSASRDRVQERCLIVKVIHNKPEDFKVVTTTIQYKIIK